MVAGAGNTWGEHIGGVPPAETEYSALFSKYNDLNNLLAQPGVNIADMMAHAANDGHIAGLPDTGEKPHELISHIATAAIQNNMNAESKAKEEEHEVKQEIVEIKHEQKEVDIKSGIAEKEVQAKQGGGLDTLAEGGVSPFETIAEKADKSAAAQIEAKNNPQAPPAPKSEKSANGFKITNSLSEIGATFSGFIIDQVSLPTADLCFKTSAVSTPAKAMPAANQETFKIQQRA